MNTHKFALTLLLLCLLLASGLEAQPGRAAMAHTFVVNGGLDYEDCNPGNGACDPGTWDVGHTVCTPAPGVCTLRAAIQESNASAGLDDIRFSFIGQPLQPASALPSITEAATVDGLDTGNGQSVRLDGSNAGIGANGLVLAASGCTVRNMTITGFQADTEDYNGFGIVIWGGNAVIEGNYLGSNAVGTTGLGNENGGILISGGGNNRVGGTTAAQRNIISGNDGHGIQIGDPQASTGSPNNRIIGNYIGLAPNGSAALANADTGVVVAYAASTGNQIGGVNAGEGNIISGNNQHGIAIFSGASGTLVRGNTIGLNTAGTNTIPNARLGVSIFQASNNTIGGTTTAARNFISGNGVSGVEIAEPPAQQTQAEGIVAAPIALHGAQCDGCKNVRAAAPLVPMDTAATGNVVLGNYIGLNAAGSAPLGNGNAGVMIYNASNNTVGGSVSGAGNVIAANYAGVDIRADSGTATGNLVQGNLIGTDPAGTHTDSDTTYNNGNEWGNDWGVAIEGASNNTVGGAGAAGNTISGNSGGIGIAGAAATGNQIQGNRIGTDLNGNPLARGLSNVTGIYIDGAAQTLIGGTGTLSNTIAYNIQQGINVVSGEGNNLRRNRIFANKEIAIDLGNDGRTPNDLSDADTGPNRLQNYPVFTRREGLYLWGTFSGLTNTTYNLDLYTYRVCDPLPWPGFGEGPTWVLNQNIPTDSHGHAAFMLTLPAEPADGYALAATLTDPNGNTSEFSNSPYRLYVTEFANGDAITLTGRLDPLQLPALRSCENLYTDLYVVVDGDQANPRKMTYVADGSGSSRLGWTPTQTTTHILDLYLTEINAGFSDAVFNDRLWLTPAPQVTFYHPDFPNIDALIPVPGNGTVDGNPVTIEIAVTNPSPEDLTSEVELTDVLTGKALPGKFIFPSAATRYTFPAGETTVLKFLWDTTGFAWDDAQQPVLTRTVQVTLPEQDYRNVVIRPARAEIKVRPRPAVLVHGLWSSAQEGWSAYQGFLNSIRSDWKAYAVGDGQVPGLMRTGEIASPYQASNRLGENAEQLRLYIEGVRELENAWHVDLVAHSMGGLISRYYLSSLVWNGVATDGYPVVNHLAMLGTPNLGSPCAHFATALVKAFLASPAGVIVDLVYGDPWDPVIKDLMPERLKYYNQIWRQPRDVPFSIWAGTAVPLTCHDPTVGDTVVPLPSALGIAPYGPRFARQDDDIIVHTDMTSYLHDFQRFVKPILAGGPARAHERDLPPGPSYRAFDARAAAEAYEAPVPQILWGQWADVAAGATRTITFSVPVGDALAVTLVASDTVTARLLDSQAGAAGDFTGPWFRTVWVDNPITGTWTVAVTNTDVTTASVTVGAALIGGEEELAVVVGEPGWDGMVSITATLANAAMLRDAKLEPAIQTQATEILTMSARLTNDTGDELLVNLLDDGAHGDGAAGDGIFGASVGPLDPDIYDIFVYAIGPGFYRGTTGGVYVPSAQVAKTVAPEGLVEQGDTLTYTVVISASAGATLGVFDPLQDVTFGAFVTQPVGITYADGAITGSVTMPTAQQVVIAFTVQVTAPTLADVITVTNYACVYPAAEDVDSCIWSNPADTPVQAIPPTYPVYLPLVMRNYRPTPVHTFRYSTFLGGAGDDTVNDIAIGPGGYIYLTGDTSSTAFGSGSSNRGYSSVFVAKLSPDGKTLVYLKTFGGAAESAGEAIAVDAAGNVYVTGYTHSADFPTTSGAFDVSFNGGSDTYSTVDAFITKLDANGNIVYSSYLGGSGYTIPGAGRSGGADMGRAIAVQGEYVYIIGRTESEDFPTTPGAYDRVYANVDWGLNTDLFIVKMRLAGQGSADLVYGTFLGGGGTHEYGEDVVVDSAGKIYVTGSVEDRYHSGEFPITPGAVDTTHGGWYEAFVLKFNPAGGGASDLVYSTYLGGSQDDEGHALAVDSAGIVYVLGSTGSPDFVTTAGAFDRTCGTDGNCNFVSGWGYYDDAFITSINPNPSGSAQANLRYSTFLGGSDDENKMIEGSIALVASGEVYVAGVTDSLNFPVTPDAYAPRPSVSGDVFVARLRLEGKGTSDLVYGTYVGGHDIDEALGLTWSNNVVTVVGDTWYHLSITGDFPTTPDALYPTHNGGGEYMIDSFLFQFGVTLQ
jgi:parallel beta-helix repeat protein